MEAEGARAEAELGAEGVIEIRNVAETGVEGDVEHFVLRRCKAHGGFTQTRATNVLMGRQTGDSSKSAKEMVRAETRFSGENVDAKGAVRIVLD